MHETSGVIDGHVVITGSMNWTSAGEGGNDENTVIVYSKKHAAQYTEWFERLWEQVDDRWLHKDPDPESKQSGTACTDGSDGVYPPLSSGADSSAAGVSNVSVSKKTNDFTSRSHPYCRACLQNREALPCPTDEVSSYTMWPADG